MNAPSLRVEHRQHQTLTPRLQHAVRLLQRSSLDFAQEVHDAMGRNPFLEVDESQSDAHEPMARAAANEGEPPRPLADTALADRSAEADDAWERDSWQQTSSSVRPGAGEGAASAMDLVAATSGLRAHLRSQANMLPLSARDHVLVCAVIESLDDDGCLRLSLDELGHLAELDPVVDLCEMNTALRLVQSLEPSGVGARDVAECLMLQLRQAQGIDLPLARAILTSHLDRLAQRDVPGLARPLGHSAAEIKTVCQQIRGLDPRPGWRGGSHDIQFVTPDVIVRKSRGQWSVQLNPAIVPRVRPAGVFELKYFFSRAMPTRNGGSCSPTAIRGVIQDMIAGENPSAPLSDVDLARQLARQGLTVARRTITKYRQLLEVPPAGRRRKHVC